MSTFFSTDISENGVESMQVTETFIPTYLLPQNMFIFRQRFDEVCFENDADLKIKHRENLTKAEKPQKKPKLNSTTILRSNNNQQNKRINHRPPKTNSTNHEISKLEVRSLGATTRRQV